MEATQKTAQSGEEILVVDDNQDAAKTLGWLLEMQGHRVQLAYNAEDALTFAEQFKPRVVMLDIGMPGTTGYDLCAKMRKMPGMDKSVFIAQTGWGQEKHKQLSKEVGFDHHMVKPIEMKALQEVLASLPKS